MSNEYDPDMFKKYNSESELENLNPITDISSSLGSSLQQCITKLENKGYTIVSGDIRES